MNEADRKAFGAACNALHAWGYSEEFSRALWQTALEYARSKSGEPVIYQCRMQPTWTDRQPWTPWSECTKGTYEDCRRVRVNGDWRYESRALYATPPAAQINQQMLEALEAFINAWGDCLGHPDTEEERFRLSEARDKAESAVLAAATQMRGDA